MKLPLSADDKTMIADFLRGLGIADAEIDAVLAYQPPPRRRRQRQSLAAMQKELDAILKQADDAEAERQARIAAGTDTPADHRKRWKLHGLREKEEQ